MDALDELERRFAEAIEAEQAAAAEASARGGMRGRLRRLRGTGARRRAGGGRHGRGARPRVPLGAVVAAASLVLAAVVAAALLVGAGGGGPLTPAQQLERIAETAEHGPAAPVLHGSQVWYQRDETTGLAPIPFNGATNGPPPTARRVALGERWESDGPLRRSRTLTLRASIPGGRDRASWRAHGSPSLTLGDGDTVATLPESDLDLRTVAGTPFRWEELSSLPTDPRALLRKIVDAHRAQQQRHGRHPSDREYRVTQVTAVRELLRSPIEPRLRAALVKALPLLPGADVVGRGSDGHGRPGLVVSVRAGAGDVQQLIVGDDGRLLGMRRPDSSTVYLVGAVAPSVMALPPGVAPPPGRLPRTRHIDPP